MPVHQLRAHHREPLRLGRQLPGVRLRAHPGGLVAARAGDHETARQQPVTSPLVHRLGLAGQQRLIGLQARAGAHHAVCHQLIARPQVDQITGHQLRYREFPRRTVADHPDPGSAEHRQPVERQLRAQLLPDTDHRIGDKHDPEQSVLRLAHDQDHRQQDAQDEVEPRHDVRAQDLAHRPAGTLPARVPQPPRAPLGNLRAAQTARPRHPNGQSRHPWRRGSRISHVRSPIGAANGDKAPAVRQPGRSLGPGRPSARLSDPAASPRLPAAVMRRLDRRATHSGGGSGPGTLIWLRTGAAFCRVLLPLSRRSRC